MKHDVCFVSRVVVVVTAEEAQMMFVSKIVEARIGAEEIAIAENLTLGIDETTGMMDAEIIDATETAGALMHLQDSLLATPPLLA